MKSACNARRTLADDATKRRRDNTCAKRQQLFAEMRRYLAYLPIFAHTLITPWGVEDFRAGETLIF